MGEPGCYVLLANSTWSRRVCCRAFASGSQRRIWSRSTPPTSRSATPRDCERSSPSQSQKTGDLWYFYIRASSYADSSPRSTHRVRVSAAMGTRPRELASWPRGLRAIAKRWIDCGRSTGGFAPDRLTFAARPNRSPRRKRASERRPSAVIPSRLGDSLTSSIDSRCGPDRCSGTRLHGRGDRRSPEEDGKSEERDNNTHQAGLGEDQNCGAPIAAANNQSDLIGAFLHRLTPSVPVHASWADPRRAEGSRRTSAPVQPIPPSSGPYRRSRR
jgi:hypothetical protein